MPSKLFLCLIASVYLLTSESEAGVVTVDFNSFADGTIIAPGDLDSIGVRFDQLLEVDDGDITPPIGSGNYAINQTSFASSITGAFVGTSVTAISVLAGDSGGDLDRIQLNGYNSGGVLVDSDVFEGVTAQTLAISGSGIVRFEILDVNDTRFIIDDFTFTTASSTVPEPTSASIWGLSLFVLSLFRRKR